MWIYRPGVCGSAHLKDLISRVATASPEEKREDLQCIQIHPSPIGEGGPKGWMRSLPLIEENLASFL